MENNNKDIWWGWLVLVILVAIIGFAAYALVTGKNITAIEVVLTALILKLGTMIDYRYGSSKGSAQKTELLAEKEAPAPVQAPASPPGPATPLPIPAPVAPVQPAVEQPAPAILEGMMAVTQEMYDADPTLAERGVKVGDLIEIPKSNTEA